MLFISKIKLMAKLATLTVVLLFMATTGLSAQEIPTAGGGEATGTGGTSSYAIGQVFFSTQNGNGGTVSQGVEQPFEIFITLGMDEHSILLMGAHPNPTEDNLILTTETAPINLSYGLYDVHRKLIENRKITSAKTTISVENLPQAIYFLNVTRNSHLVKTFKIIKK